jgi:hypothetical protein
MNELKKLANNIYVLYNYIIILKEDTSSMKFKKALSLGLAFLPIFNIAALSASAISLESSVATPTMHTRIPDGKASVEFELVNPSTQERTIGFFFVANINEAVAALICFSSIPEFLGCYNERVTEMLRDGITPYFEVGKRVVIVIERVNDVDFRVDVRKPAADSPHPLDIMIPRQLNS